MTSDAKLWGRNKQEEKKFMVGGNDDDDGDTDNDKDGNDEMMIMMMTLTQVLLLMTMKKIAFFKRNPRHRSTVFITSAISVNRSYCTLRLGPAQSDSLTTLTR